MRRILVTGATGTVGSAVVDELVSSGLYEVHAVVRAITPMRERVVPVVLDLERPGFFRELAEAEYDGIVHVAQKRCGGDVGGENFDLRVVRGLEQLCTGKTRRLIYTSGVWVYGHQREGEVIREDSPLNPVSAATERMETLAYLRNGSRCPWVEAVLPSLVYGTMGPLLNIRDAVRAGNALAVVDPAIRWSLVERSDAGAAYRLLLESACEERVFVVAEAEALPVVEVYRRVAAHLNVPFEGVDREALARAVSATDFEVMTMNQPADSSLLRRLTGWQPKHAFTNSHKLLLADA